MIFIGYDDPEKLIEIERYRAVHDIGKVVVISANEFPLPVPDSDIITYADVIMYVTFYRLLQEIDSRTLIVINECLRVQNRYDLTYNCIRNYLNQTGHQLIFQQLPQIDERDDFMVLFDFDTRSRWKRQKFDPALVRDNAEVRLRPLPLAFDRIDVPTSAATRKKYAAERERLFAALGARDPHTLPRNLYLIGGKDKLAYVDGQACPATARECRRAGGQLSLFEPGATGCYVARNKRLNRDSVVTYADVSAEGGPYTVIEFPHRFIDFADFVRRTGQARSQVLVADLKVDRWYFDRYQEWKDRICETYAALQQS